MALDAGDEKVVTIYEVNMKLLSFSSVQNAAERHGLVKDCESFADNCRQQTAISLLRQPGRDELGQNPLLAIIASLQVKHANPSRGFLLRRQKHWLVYR